jgi:hypothetical protein
VPAKTCFCSAFRRSDFPLYLPLILVAPVWLWDLGGRGYWNDEALSLVFARLPLEDLAPGIDPYNPSLYFVFLKAWSSLAGEGEAVCRLPSVLAALAGVALTVRAASRHLGPRAALFTACLAAASPGWLLYARECRAYPFLLLWVASILNVIPENGRAPSRRQTIGLGVLLALGIHLHLTAALVWLAVAAAALHRRLALKESPKPLMFALGCAALLLAPTVFSLKPVVEEVLRLATGRDVIPIGSYPVRAGYAAFGWVLGETVLPWRWEVVLPAAVLSMIAMCCALGFVRTSALAFTAATLCATAPLLLAATSKPSPRYAALAMPGFLILAGCGFSRFRSGPLLVSALSGLTVLGAVNYFRGIDYHNMALLDPYREIAADIHATRRPGERILLAGSEAIPLQHYLPDASYAYVSQRSPENVLVAFDDRDEPLPLDIFLKNPFPENTRLWLVINSAGQETYARDLEANQQRIVESLKSSKAIDFERRYLFDINAEEKSRWVGKTFRPWRVDVYCYKSLSLSK